MKDGDYIVSINEEDVKWAPHDQVVSLIKRSGNALKLRLITPLQEKKESSHRISHESSSALKSRGSSSPTASSASSTSGHSSGGALQSFSQPSGGELSSSPASSVTSGSTRSHHHQKHSSEHTKNWNPFKKGIQNNTTKTYINENIILR